MRAGIRGFTGVSTPDSGACSSPAYTQGTTAATGACGSTLQLSSFCLLEGFTLSPSSLSVPVLSTHRSTFAMSSSSESSAAASSSFSMAATSAAPAYPSALAGSKRPRMEDEVSAPPSLVLSELPTPVLSFLCRSEVLHTGAEAAIRATLADAVAALPYSACEVGRFLAILAVGATPPFTLASDNCASLLFLAPMYPALRALSVRDAARAWVLVDMLCLDATHRIEDDLVQRYAEDPSAEEDWRGALTVAGCPACDTLWELLTKK